MQRLYPILLTTLLLFAGQLSAQIVENFDYDVGTTLEGQAGGSGWSAAWSVRKGNEQAEMAAGGVVAAGVGATSTPPHLFVQHEAGMGGIRAARLLDEAITDDGNTYYLSWFQESDYETPADNGSVAQVIIVNDLAYASGGPGGQLVRMGKIFGTERFGIDGVRTGGASFIDGTDTREAIFVVVAIDMSGDEERETLRFYINPDLDTEELDEDDADLTITADMNDGFDALGFKVEGGGSLDSRIDGLRFGSELSDVLPDDPDPVAGGNRDNFNDYATGATLNGLDGGTGWDGGWVTVSGDDPVITEGGLQNATTELQTSGNHVAAEYSGTEGDSRYFRKLEAPVMDDGRTYYFSYTSVSSYTAQADQADFFMFIDSENLAPTGPGGQVFQIGKPLSTPFIGAGFGATGNFELSDAEATDVNFVVVKLITNGTEEPDTVQLFINPDTDGGEPEEADVTKVAGRINDGFDAVGFKVTGLSAGNTLDWDDVRAGLSYDYVIPQDFEDFEPPLTVLAVETFNDYTEGDTLGGLDGGSGWAGPWMAMPSSDNSMIRASGLLNNTLAAGTSGNSLRMSADGMTERSVRFFESALDTTENAEFWFSAHLGVGGGPEGTVGNLILVDTVGGFSQQVILGKQFGNRNIFAVGDGQIGGATQTGRQFDGTGASFVVGHMTRDTGRWNLDLYVDPDPTAEMLPEDSAQIINKGYRSGNFAGVAVRIDGTGTELVWDVDDIYIGSSYADVVPEDLTTVTEAPPGARELFSYDVGSDLIGQDGGEGWAGPWELLSESGEATIQEEGVASQPLLRATSGPSVRLESYLRAVRPLEGTYGDNGREFWIGWWFDVDDPAGNVAHLVLADTATYAATGPGGQLAQIGKLFGGTTLGVVSAQGGQADGSDVSEGQFVVAHVITDGTAANDQIMVWIDPDLTTTPSADTADITAGANLANWNAIGLKFEGDADVATTAVFDDVIVGFAFSEVIPNGLQELEPPNTPRAAVEVFDYEAGQDLNGANGGEGWAGPWEAIAGTAVIAEGNVESERTCPEGNSASITQSGADMPTVYRRDFTNPFATGEENSTFYASFVLNGVAKDIGNSALVSFVSGENNILSIGGVPGLSSLAVFRNDDEAATITNNFSVQGTKWFVVRMDINGATGLATARIFVDPIADAIPADETAVFTIENVSVLDGITGIEFSGEGAQSVELAVDDIRAGFSYRDISCQFGSDDPNLLAYEPFNYDPNTSLEGAGGENAFWNGAWGFGAPNQANTIIVQEGSLENEALDEEANRVELSLLAEGEQLRIDRELAFPIESDGRTYWLSFLMNTVDGAAGNNVGNITLNNSQINGDDKQRLIIGRLFAERLLGIAVPGNPRRTEIVDEGQNWIVVRMQTNADANILDTVTMWIDPPASATAPDTGSAGFGLQFTTLRLKSGIDQVRMRVEGAGAGQTPYVTQFDEIALATQWSSIVGITNSIFTAPAVDVFNLAVFPNPTAGRLTVRYDLPASGEVRFDLLDLSGRRVAELPRRNQVAGTQTVTLDGELRGLPNGVYFLRLSQAGVSATGKVVLYR